MTGLFVTLSFGAIFWVQKNFLVTLAKSFGDGYKKICRALTDAPERNDIKLNKTWIYVMH